MKTINKIIKETGLDNNCNRFVYVGKGHGRRFGRLMDDEKGFYVRHYTGDVLKRIKTDDILEIMGPNVPKALRTYRVVLDAILK